jgi:RimJ/RimL family protein N-acetyltransferase
MANVRLEPMTQPAYEAWRGRSVAEYAAENVRSGRWTEDEAKAKSEEEFRSLLPNGLATPGHFLWTVRADDDSAVGILWVATDRRPGQAFIYDIKMDAHRRGEGFGTATLLALDDWSRANGISTIGLHVFAHNEGAWRLYKRMGYVETNIQMTKQL